MRTRLALGTLAAVLVLLALAAAWLLAGLPDLGQLDAHLARYAAQPSLRITDRSGRLLYEWLPEQGGRHIPIAAQAIPEALKQATVSTEDASFYTNPGIDPAGIARAVWINLWGGETVSGGSTITQQVARNLLLEPAERNQRSLRRKLREAWLAWQITRRLGKDEILALYLNQSYYGGMAYGVEAAAQTYFGKPAAELDLAESALLAGLNQAPGLYNPYTDFEAAKARQAVVLGLMRKHGLISAQQQELAAREPLELAAAPYPMEAPHFVMMVLAELDTRLPASQRPTDQALSVRTSLDLDWQHHAEAIIKRQIEALNHPPPGETSHNVNNAALVALDPYSGEILALVGSPDYFEAQISGAVNMALAPVQPGSALKPLIYAAAFDSARPQPWTPATLIFDVRTTFLTGQGKPYIPENYDLTEHGPVLAREALASSLNIPAVATLNEVGLEAAAATAARLGITTLRDTQSYDLSLALGGGAVRLLELTAAYGAFGNGGLRVEPAAILDVRTAGGELLYSPNPPERRQVLDPRLAWLVTDILSDDQARRIGFGTNSVLRLDRPAAAKTGTTTNFHDNLTVGYTPDLVVGVWVGNADHQAMRDITGLTGAAPIWHQFMRTVLRGRPKLDFRRPEGLVRAEVCALSGLRPTSDCPYRRLEWFIAGTEPQQDDWLYRRVEIDAVHGGLAGPQTAPADRLELLALDLPPQAQPWGRSQGWLIFSDLLQQPLEAGLSLLSPGANAVFRLDPNTHTESQQVRFLAAGAGPESVVTVWLDGQPLHSFTGPPYEVWWPLQLGQHRAWVEAVLPGGERQVSLTVVFEVR